MTLLLPDGQAITNGRKWGLRAAIAILFVPGLLSQLAARGGLVNAPFRAAGMVIGLGIVYYVGLRLLSEDESAQQAADT